MSVIQVIQGKIKGSQGIIGVAERAQVTLTTAQILALHTTPVTLIAGVAGKTISIDEILVTCPAAGSTAYTGANAVEVRYTGAAGAKATGDLAAAALNSITSRTDKLIAAAVTAVTGDPIVAVVPTADPGAGTGGLTFDIIYRRV
jgi:hypothetical protein